MLECFAFSNSREEHRDGRPLTLEQVKEAEFDDVQGGLGVWGGSRRGDGGVEGAEDEGEGC